MKLMTAGKQESIGQSFHHYLTEQSRQRLVSSCASQSSSMAAMKLTGKNGAMTWTEQAAHLMNSSVTSFTQRLHMGIVDSLLIFQAMMHVLSEKNAR